jgi:hypothetical protein
MEKSTNHDSTKKATTLLIHTNQILNPINPLLKPSLIIATTVTGMSSGDCKMARLLIHCQEK